jgi:hypothetical protein
MEILPLADIAETWQVLEDLLRDVVQRAAARQDRLQCLRLRGRWGKLVL